MIEGEPQFDRQDDAAPDEATPDDATLMMQPLLMQPLMMQRCCVRTLLETRTRSALWWHGIKIECGVSRYASCGIPRMLRTRCRMPT